MSQSARIKIFILSWLGGTFAGMSANLFSLMLPDALMELLASKDPSLISQVGSIIISLFLIGWSFGGFFGGFIADRYGRIKAMSASILLYSLFTGIAGLSKEVYLLAACRFFIGVGVGSLMVSISILLRESWPKESRAIAIGCLITSYQVGVFLSGLLGKFFPNWHEAFLIGCIPAFLACIVYKTLEEPKEWLLTQKIPSTLGSLFSHHNRKNLWIGSFSFGALLVGYWASVSFVPTWIFHLSEKGLVDEKNNAMIFHGFCAIAGCLLSGPLANRWGCVKSLFSLFLGAILTSSILFLTNDTFHWIIYFQYGLLGGFIGGLQSLMYIYIPELFTTSQRGAGTGFCLNSGRAMTAILVLFMGSLVSFLGGYAYALFAFSCFYIVAGAAVLFGKETREEVGQS